MTRCRHCDMPAGVGGSDVCDHCRALKRMAIKYAIAQPRVAHAGAVEFASWYADRFGVDFQARRAPDFGPQLRAWAREKGMRL